MKGAVGAKILSGGTGERYLSLANPGDRDVLEDMEGESVSELLRRNIMFGDLDALDISGDGMAKDSMDGGSDLSSESVVMLLMSGSSITQLLSLITGRVNALMEDDTMDLVWHLLEGLLLSSRCLPPSGCRPKMESDLSL